LLTARAAGGLLGSMDRVASSVDITVIASSSTLRRTPQAPHLTAADPTARSPKPPCPERPGRAPFGSIAGRRASVARRTPRSCRDRHTCLISGNDSEWRVNPGV
jgi:hypothetical protein